MRTARSAVAAVAVLVLVAAALRCYGTDWGAPYGYHFDEPFVLKPALRMVERGDPNPHFFRYPSALIYTEAAIALAYHRLCGMDLTVPTGPAYGPSDLGPWSWPALLAGRRFVAAIGALTVAAGALLAWRVGGPTASLATAALLAVLPLHAEHSHYLTTDVPAAGLALLSLALAAGPASRSSALAAGAALGAAVATKYTAGAALPATLLLVAASGERRPLNVVWTLTAAVGTFFVLCPYAALDWRVFLADINIVREHYASGHLGSEGSANWGWYLERLTESGLGAGGLIAVGTGMLVALAAAARDWVDGYRRNALAIVVIGLTALCWFAWLGTVRVRFERNLIPAAVLAVVTAGCGAGRLIDWARRRGTAAFVPAVLVFALVWMAPARMAVRAAARFGKPDTRQRAANWIADNIPPGAKIVREEYGPRPDPTRYQVEYIWSVAFRDPSWYRRNGIDAVVVSSLVYRRFLLDPEQRYPRITERYRRIFAWPRRVRIAPGPGELGPILSIYRPPPLPEGP